MKFSGRIWLNIKSQKKQGFILFPENTNFTNTVKILSKRTLSEISEFSILPYTQNWKLGNLGKFCFNYL